MWDNLQDAYNDFQALKADLSGGINNMLQLAQGVGAFRAPDILVGLDDGGDPRSSDDSYDVSLGAPNLYTGLANLYPPLTVSSTQYYQVCMNAGVIQTGISSTGTLYAINASISGTISAGGLDLNGPLTMSSASGSIAIGTTPPTSATVGTGLWIDRTGVYALLANVQQATLTSAGLTAGAGAVKADVDGITFNQSGSFLVFQNQTTGTYSVGAKQNAGEYGLQEIAFTATATPTITNPGAETGDMTGWGTIAGSPTASTVQKHSGTYSFLLDAAGEGIISSSFTNITGPSGLLELWMYASAYGVILQAEIKCYDAGSVLLGTANAMMISAPSSGETGIGRFAKYYFAGLYIAGTTKIKIAITNIGGSSLYVDDIVFRDGTGYQTGISTTWPGMLLSGDLEVSNDFNVNGSAYFALAAPTTLQVAGGPVIGVSDQSAFTPIIIGTTTAGAGTYTTQLGECWVWGKFTHIEIQIVWTAHTGTGNMRIDALPYTKKNNGIDAPGAVQWNNITLLAVGNKIIPAILANTTQIVLNEIGSGAASAIPMDTAGTIRISATYLRV